MPPTTWPSLKLAQDKYAAAQIAMTAESYKKARLLAEQAELDARLAESKVLTQKSKDQARRAGQEPETSAQATGETD